MTKYSPIVWILIALRYKNLTYWPKIFNFFKAFNFKLVCICDREKIIHKCKAAWWVLTLLLYLCLPVLAMHLFLPFLFLKKNRPTPASFSFIFGLFKQTLQIFNTNICEKMSIQYTVLGFEPTTFGTWVSSHNQQ